MSITFNNNKHHQPPQNTMMPIHPINDIPSPFGDPPSNLPTSDLRETAYEILLAACRSSGPKPLTFISQSERGIRDPAPAASLHRSRTSMAASKVKKALGLKTTSLKSKRAVTTGELVRVHMKISEQSESRIRRALLRIAAAQVSILFFPSFYFWICSKKIRKLKLEAYLIFIGVSEES
jgi:hypothetical protein